MKPSLCVHLIQFVPFNYHIDLCLCKHLLEMIDICLNSLNAILESFSG